MQTQLYQRPGQKWTDHEVPVSALRIDVQHALLADRGTSEDEIETNKTLKMINQRIKDFEKEFSLVAKLG